MKESVRNAILNAAHDPSYCIVKENGDKRTLVRPDAEKISKAYGIPQNVVEHTIEDFGLKFPVTYTQKGSDWYLKD